MADPSRFELVILRGLARHKHRPVQGPAFLIGRANDCDLVLGDSQFPDVHSCLLTSRGGLWLRHLGFTPEITVNGQPVSRVQLLDGDRIRMGPYEFQLHVDRPARRDLACQPAATLPGRKLLGRGPQSTQDAIAAVRELVAEVRGDVIGEPQTLRLFAGVDSAGVARTVASATLPARSLPIPRHIRRA